MQEQKVTHLSAGRSRCSEQLFQGRCVPLVTSSLPPSLFSRQVTHRSGFLRERCEGQSNKRGAGWEDSGALH